MKSITLVGVNTLGEPVKLAKEVVSFTDAKNYFKVTLDVSSVTITTPKGVYTLEKHPTMNIYQGKCGDTKTHVSLKKIVGELRYW